MYYLIYMISLRIILKMNLTFNKIDEIVNEMPSNKKLDPFSIVIDNIELLDKAKTARGQLLNIPEKYATILNNYKNLNDTYKLQKKKIENMN